MESNIDKWYCPNCKKFLDEEQEVVTKWGKPQHKMVIKNMFASYHKCYKYGIYLEKKLLGEIK